MNSDILKTINYIKRNGIADTWWAVLERLREKKNNHYSYEEPKRETLDEQRLSSKDFGIKVSILVPAYETPKKYLEELVASVCSQSYENWELVIADASDSTLVKDTLSIYKDERIKYIKLSQNAGISQNTNEGLKYCTGEYTALLDHDDILTADALFYMVSKVKNTSECNLKMVYSDEDKTDGDNNIYFDANIKPDFNLSLLLSNNYICHFLMLETALMKKLGFRKEYDGAQDHDLILRAVSELKKEYGKAYLGYIGHVDKVLYHWRCHMASTAANPKSKEYAYDAGKRAIEDYLKRESIDALVISEKHVGFFYVDYADNLYTKRPETGARCGRIVNAFGTVKAGPMDDVGKYMFEGINVHESGGSLHRASCQMEVPYADIRCMEMSKELKTAYEKFLQDKGPLDKKTDYHKLSLEFCDIIKNSGYDIMYDPKFVLRGKQ